MGARTDRFRRLGGRNWVGTFFVCVSFTISGCGGSSTNELIEQSHSKNSADRSRAARVLGERASEADASVPVLAELLKDEDAFVRRDAARALGQFGSAARSSEASLQKATNDRNAHVRQSAQEALQKVNPTTPRMVLK